MRAWSSIRAVLFDWDGTLLGSYCADLHAYLKMFHGLGVDWGEEELRRHYSPDWYRVYTAAGIPRARWAEADRLWRRFYQGQSPALMPGARRVLHWLAPRFRLGLVTSGDRERVRRQLRSFKLTQLFSVRVYSEDAGKRKPHPRPLQLALRRLRLPPEACVYVGDTPEDIEMARRAGVRPIAVLGPFPTHRRLRAARADALLESIEDLPRLLEPYGALR